MNNTPENDRPGFKDTFIAVGQQTLSKRRTDYVYSVGVLVTGLMVLAGLLYFLTPIASIVALVCAIIVMWGRWIILRQVTQDFADMRTVKEGYTATENAEYLEFIRLRGEQMLNDNKALTPLAKQEITQLMDWAASHTT